MLESLDYLGEGEPLKTWLDYVVDFLNRRRTLRGGGLVSVNEETDGWTIRLNEEIEDRLADPVTTWQVFEIIGNTVVTADAQWTYTAKKVVKVDRGYNGWISMSSDRNDSGGLKIYTLHNLNEDGNAASGTFGNGVHSSDLQGTFKVQPAPVGTKVHCWQIVFGLVDAGPPGSMGDTTASEWFFDYQNGVTGGC